MLFKRRTTESLWQRLRILLWPRRSFSRSMRYFAKRVLRLRATPHAVAVGVAAGVFASFFPFMGLHFIMAGLIAWLLAGNIVAAALGTAFGNPLTFPVLWAASYETGKIILHEPVPAGPPAGLGAMLHHLRFSELWGPVLKPMTVGAVPLGLVCALIVYGVTRWTAGAFHENRRKRWAERQAAS